ncbi:hypothetical protein ACH5RR_041163 [Cinchona calisaya]|uniref:Uncharacterized protein n=1 Tax=Cinchona calisaya TaxID=153742 RepID=A0ABD2XVD1_9GENT
MDQHGLMRNMGENLVIDLLELSVHEKDFPILGGQIMPSRNLKKIMKLRDIALECINVVVGIGRQTSLQYDDWHDVGPLMKVFSPAII